MSTSGYNSTLKYKTFNSLLSDVRADFSNYALENLIDPASLIRVAARCNYDLGIRIHQTKEALVEIDKGRAKLPDNFYSMNFAMLCGSYTETVALTQGIQTEERPILPRYYSTPANLNTCQAPVVCSNCHLVPCGCSTIVNQIASPTCGCGDPCTCGQSNICADAVYNPQEPYGDWWQKPRVFLNCKGECMELVQNLRTETRHYNHLMPLRFINNAQGIECGCPGLYVRSKDEAWIKDGWIYTNIDRHNGCSKVYINYEGELEDDDGNMLVPDHYGIIPYYEYSMKATLLENMLMNGEDVMQKLLLMEDRRKIAKGAAKAIVRMPNFEEMRTLHDQNKKAMWNRYYSQFSSASYFNRY